MGLSKGKNLQERKWARIYFANKASMLIEVAGGCSNLDGKQGSRVRRADTWGILSL